MSVRSTRALALLAAALLAACATSPAPPDSTPAASGALAAVDTGRVFGDLRRLSDDSMRGRRAGTADGERARRWIADEFARIGVARIGDSYIQPFSFTSRRDSTPRSGGNVLGVVRGSARPGRVLVVSAHYDHLGVGAAVNGDSIFNGADDNASGTAALLEIARWFAAHPPRHTLLFAAFDAEESGLKGAEAFVAAPPVPLDSIAMNLNMDMVSHSTKGELYVTGSYQYPQLKPYVQRLAASAPVRVLMGHDTPQDTGEDNWVNSSDQGPFNAKHIPFLYFGVEDHPDYHRQSDEWRTITPVFYGHAVETVLAAVRLFDQVADSIAVARP